MNCANSSEDSCFPRESRSTRRRREFFPSWPESFSRAASSLSEMSSTSAYCLRRFRYSSLSDWIAGCLVLPIHAMVSFTRVKRILTAGVAEIAQRTPRKPVAYCARFWVFSAFSASLFSAFSAVKSFCFCLCRLLCTRTRNHALAWLGDKLCGVDLLRRFPEPFEIVILPRRLRKNVDYEIHIVDQHPLTLTVSFNIVGIKS